MPSTLQIRVVVPFPTMETRPLLSTVATAELAVDQEGVDVAPETLICTVVPLGMVKSVILTGVLVEVDVPGMGKGRHSPGIRRGVKAAPDDAGLEDLGSLESGRDGDTAHTAGLAQSLDRAVFVHADHLGIAAGPFQIAYAAAGGEGSVNACRSLGRNFAE